MRKLRVAQVIVQPVVVWDDGEELSPGPELGKIAMPLSQLSELTVSLPEQLVLLQEQLENKEAEPTASQ